MLKKESATGEVRPDGSILGGRFGGFRIWMVLFSSVSSLVFSFSDKPYLSLQMRRASDYNTLCSLKGCRADIPDVFLT
jgi:hypothetical protein